ncbi:MAG: ABC transporter permease [Candidatus Nanopelagicales bacterium]|nr:ABC transporter permease [Candidatus Nanopelagicales bacterium]
MALDTSAPPAPVEPEIQLPISYKAPITMGVLGVFALVVFGLMGDPAKTTTFDLTIGTEAFALPDVAVPSMAFSVVTAVLCLIVAGYALVRARSRRRVPWWAILAFGLAFILSFLSWVAAGKTLPVTGLLQGTILLSVPLIFGAQSGVLCERAGVVNIAIEGQLLAGAFMSAVVGSLTNNIWLGLLAAVVAGLLVAWVLAVFAVTYFVDQVIVGVVINTLVLGLTSFFYTAVLSQNVETWNSPPVMQRIAIPVLSDIPILGPVLFNQSLIVYLMYVLVAVVHVGLFRTRWGLRVRAVGEHPKAADTVGIDVNRVRFRNVLLGGMAAGLGGAFFTLGSVGAFGKAMTAGKGFIALAAMIFGRWSPLGAVGAALLFGFADQLQQVLSIIGTPIPSQFMLMAPYLATLFVVAGLAGRSRAPAADGVPYIKS